MWPFNRKTEARESSFTDTLVSLLVQRASGSTARATATGALESASGMVGRCFANATVNGPARYSEAVTPLILSTLGRGLVRRGEVVLAMAVDPEGAIRLVPASDWDVQGDYEPETWVYRLNMAGPSRMTTLAHVPGSGVVHVRYQLDVARPWAGVGPLQAASLAGKLSAETAAALGDEMSGPRGSVLPMPTDGNDPTLTALKADIKKLSGQVAMVESVRSQSATPATAPQDDWKPRRIGGSPPAPNIELMGTATMEVLSACGVPPGLFQAGEGTGQRESFRRFLHTTIQPLGNVVSRELSDKFETDITLNFDALFAADLSGRARGFQSMVRAGMAVDRAASLAGLLADDG